MSDSPFNPEPDDSKPARTGGIGATVFLVLFASPFAGFGLLAAIQGIRKLVAGNIQDGLPLCLFGLIFSSVGFGLMFAAIFARKKAKETVELQARFAGKLWMLRKDWAGGEIKSNARGQVVLFWIMALAFCGFGFPILFVVIPQELHKGNKPALLALFFPLAGIGLLTAAIYQTLRWMKYGAVIFKMKSVPGIIGGVLVGTLRIPAHFQPQSGISLRLCCVHRIVTGSGKSRSVSESVYWEDEKHLGDNLPRTGPDEYDVPVFFKVPGDGRETDNRRSDDQIIWRLTAASRQAGIDFRADFEVPVFKVTDEVMGDMADPTAALQIPDEEIVRNEHSRIKVSDVADGREFYFPAARNLLNVIYFTAGFLVWTGFTLAAFLLFQSLFFEIVFGLVDALIAWGCFNLWFKSSRVTLNSSGLTLQRRWLFIKKTRQFAAGEIVRFETNVGMTSGQTAYQNIKLVTPAGADSFAARKARYQQTGERPPLKFGISDPTGVTLASGIASKTEAEWLVREMTRALGRKI